MCMTLYMYMAYLFHMYHWILSYKYLESLQDHSMSDKGFVILP